MKELDFFGKTIIEKVRDESINQWDLVIEGKMGPPEAKEYYEKFKKFKEDDLDVIKNLIFEVVDTTLFNTLFMFVENEDNVSINVDLGEGIVNITEESDDLHGELFSENGWIFKYSKKPHKESE